MARQGVTLKVREDLDRVQMQIAEVEEKAKQAFAEALKCGPATEAGRIWIEEKNQLREEKRQLREKEKLLLEHLLRHQEGTPGMCAEA
jgi:hypothetical protein